MNDTSGNNKGEVVLESTGELVGTAPDVAQGIAKVTANSNIGDILKITGTHKVEKVVGNKCCLEFAAGAKSL